jgi:hypothetical protein
MRRRDFITLLVGGAAMAWPLAVRAQLQPKMLRVGFVGMQPREFPLYANFLKRMAELGYQETAVPRRVPRRQGLDLQSSQTS